MRCHSVGCGAASQERAAIVFDRQYRQHLIDDSRVLLIDL